MMKRVAVTEFAIFYILVVCVISDYRTSATLEAASQRQQSDANADIDKFKIFVPHYRDARILQNQFVVEAPKATPGISLVIDRYLVLTAALRGYGQALLQTPSRAPPPLN